MTASPLDDVVHVFLSAGPVDLASKYFPLDSTDYWEVVQYTDFLNTLLAEVADTFLDQTAHAALDDAVAVMYDAIPRAQLSGLTPNVQTAYSKLTDPGSASTDERYHSEG